MTPEQLATAVKTALTEAVTDGALTLAEADIPSQVTVERPRQREHGDWATNVALQLAKKAGVPPRALAEELAGRLREVAGVAAVDIAGPGFLNITLDKGAAGELARTIVEAGGEYGRSQANAEHRINLEFVSANPTGPVHLGGGRWAAVGDSMARILEFTGAEVTREYYFNDHGGQIDRFARSLLASARGEDPPADGYGGDYISDITAQVLAQAPDVLTSEDPQEVFRSIGVGLMFDEVKRTLHDFGVDFDVYFHEDSVHTSGAVTRAIERLQADGRMFEQNGALWLRTTDFGDDKDRAVIKSDGEPTYFAGDLAYYLHKRERGFDRNIIILGADHHGYVGRMMAMCAAFGDTPGENLEIIIGQMVNLVRNGQPLRMSKRAGTVVTLEDLVEVVGNDAARYALARSSADSNIDVDLDLLARNTNDNPVYYVQYAHARTSGVARNARELGVSTEAGFDPSLLDHPTEAVLLGALAEFPRIITQSAELREPHRVARYLEELAGHFHAWYVACRVTPLSGEPVTDTHVARLWLLDATRTVLATGLGLLGVSAPERM